MEGRLFSIVSFTSFWLLPLLLLLAFAQAEEPNLNQQIVLRNLCRARSTVAHVQTLPSFGTSPLCLQQFKSSLRLITDAESQVLSQDWEATKQIVASAILANVESVCWNGPIHDDEIDPSYLASELDRHLKAAQNELEITTSKPFNIKDLEKNNSLTHPGLNNEVAIQSNTQGETELNRNGCPTSNVDGSKCQFSACGKAYGLVSCAIGFAKGVVGGLHGLSYVVTSDGDNALNPSPGTLRYATNLARGSNSGKSSFSIHTEQAKH